MDVVFLTLQSHGRKVDLELPKMIPVGLLIPPIFSQLGWSSTEIDMNTVSVQVNPTGKQIKSSETLYEAGVKDGNIVELILFAEKTNLELEIDANTKGPFLQSKSGQSFPISSRSIIIGRPDPPRRPPDIDLTPFDTTQVTSRRHAQIWRHQNDDFWIKDLHSTNGVLVAGTPLPPGGRSPLYHGTEIQFGVEGPLFTYYDKCPTDR